MIGELRKKWYRKMFQTKFPNNLCEYGYSHTSQIMCSREIHFRYLHRITPTKNILGEPPDILDYLDFDFSDKVWFKQDSGIGDTRLGHCLGVTERITFLMIY